MVKKKTVFVSQCERDHIISGLRSGLEDIRNKRKYLRVSYELFVILHKLGLLEKELTTMERIDSINYETLRKRLLEVKKNANRLLTTKNIAVDEMRYVVKNLNNINEKMKKMAKKLTLRYNSDTSNAVPMNHKEEEVDESSLMSSVSSKPYVAPEKELKNRLISHYKARKKHLESSDRCNTQIHNTQGRPKNSLFVRSKSSGEKVAKRRSGSSLHERNMSKSQEKIELANGVSSNSGRSQQNSSVTEDLSDGKSISENHLKPELSMTSLTSSVTNVVRHSKSSDGHSYRRSNEDSRKSFPEKINKRWSISSLTTASRKYLNRNTLALNSRNQTVQYSIEENLLLNKKKTHSTGTDMKPHFVRLPGLVSPERKHLEDVRRKILSDKSCGRKENQMKNNTEGCCFNSNSLIEIFETSDTSLKIQDVAKDGLYDRYVSILQLDHTISEENSNFFSEIIRKTSDNGLTKKDGDNYHLQGDVKSRKQSLGPLNKEREKQDMSNIVENGEKQGKENKSNSTSDRIKVKKKPVDKTTQGTQSESSKITRSTSYDNFVLHPKFDWNNTLLGESFKRNIPLDKERPSDFDEFGNFQRLRKPLMDTTVATKRLKKKFPTEDKAVQTSEVIFAEGMHQVVYLNVVYTKTHVKYIIPSSMKIPILPQTPKVIERRAIDNGYAVTTYKTDPDGVIHFTLAFSEDKKKGENLPPDVKKRLCQLKDLWISSASKFLSQISDKLGKTVYVTGSVSNEDQTSSVSYSADDSSTSSGMLAKEMSSE